jgi:RimJ/RimL family protein N-acetyltransferase
MLRGKSVGLRPMEPDDAWLLYRWFNDQKVLEDMGAHHDLFCISMDEERQTVDRMLRDLDAFHCVIVPLNADQPIGMVSLARIDERNASAELRLLIGEVAEWGKGYCRDATRVMVDYGFRTRNLHRVELRVTSYNERAKACYEACGFRVDGVLRHDHFHKGQWRDSLLMTILNGELKEG